MNGPVSVDGKYATNIKQPECSVHTFEKRGFPVVVVPVRPFALLRTPSPRKEMLKSLSEEI